MPIVLRSARRHYARSSLLAQRAVREARRVSPDRPTSAAGVAAVSSVVLVHQFTAAQQAQRGVSEMLAEQSLEELGQALLNSAAFTTEVSRFEAMLDQVDTDLAFDRLVESLVQDAARAAESVAVTARPRVAWVRYLNPPSCSRCAVLAGRVYRYSDGFLRHPGCDCTMIPTTLANPAFHHDPTKLLEQGLVTGLSKADRKALADGADFNQVVNVRQRSAGLRQSGRVLARAGRPTPEAIYASTTSRDKAISALMRAGYLT